MTDWQQHYRDRHTPWDLGRAHPELERRLAAGELEPPRPGARALVPGCGRGWDAFALADAGWSVVAVDLVPDLAGAVGERLAERGGRFLVADALSLDWWGADGLQPASFQLFFDHTFYCALPLERRPDFGGLAGRALAPGGRLCSLVFPVGRPLEQGGPPFAMSPAELERSLGPDFQLRSNEVAARRAGSRAWEERWCSFERVSTGVSPGSHQ
ncbi:MAG: methyltransferase domain-containing protein [Planctomycetes bacterium]|nr:methyltransferase domain-containing protein [Planctomycetota bacterium]MBL7008162.1 methyltransferase domain-containing protein [Planctomycetota bacterium]